VDLMIGFSYGGLILQHFIADHPQLASHFVIGGSAHRISPAALAIDYRYAELVHQGQDRAAMAERAAAVVAKGPLKHLLYGVLWLFGKMLLGPVEGSFRQDVLIEAEAERAHDALTSLQKISVPVLIVCGKNDFAFALSDVQEMADMIPQSTLQVYDQGHSTVILEKRFAQDVREFVARS
jgi:pimeloyl-ACP methyl ester carboxylesterase